MDDEEGMTTLVEGIVDDEEGMTALVEGFADDISQMTPPALLFLMTLGRFLARIAEANERNRRARGHLTLALERFDRG